MNDNILKNLRQAMSAIATAAVVSIGFTACSEEAFMEQTPAAPAHGYQVSIPASRGGATTRAIAYNKDTGGYDATFETTDNISVFHPGMKSFNSNCLHPDRDGKSANLIGSLYFGETPPSVGDELVLYYKCDGPYIVFSQIFNNDKPEVDFAVASVTVESVSEDLITLSKASFYNPQSLFKINFTGINSAVKIKKAAIVSDQDKLVSWYQSDKQSFGSVEYTYYGEGIAQHELPFMLRFDNNPYKSDTKPGDIIYFTVQGSDSHVYRGSKTVTADLENGKYYHADVAVEDAGLALTLTNNTTGESLDIDNWMRLESAEAAYTFAHNGFDRVFIWTGGSNALTLDGVTISNRNSNFLEAQMDYEESDDSKEHHLVLKGENTLNSSGYSSPIHISENNKLRISALNGGKLTINALSGGIYMWDNAKLTLENAEVVLNGYIGSSIGSSIVIGAGSKFSIAASGADYEFIRAASGYKLVTSQAGDYTVYTVEAAAPYEEPKALSEATSADVGKIIGSDGKVHVPYWDLPAGVSPVAIIGGISSTGHGIAFAADKIKVWHPEEQYYDDAFSWDNSSDANNGKTAEEIFTDWQSDNAVSFGTWRFATWSDWQLMALNFRIEGDATEKGPEMVAEGLKRVLEEYRIFRYVFSSWLGEPGAEEGLRSMVIFNNWYYDEENQESYQGPYQMYDSIWTTPENSIGILPILDF